MFRLLSLLPLLTTWVVATAAVRYLGRVTKGETDPKARRALLLGVVAVGIQLLISLVALSYQVVGVG